jgi:hypothetical protein
LPDDVTPKRPASQYYWGDWWKDKGLHSCCLTARGLWHEMNCLMHEGEPYGHLTLNGRPMTIAQLANQCRITPTACKKLVDELIAAGVPSKDPESGALYSRRMVRDEKLRQLRAEIGRANGSKGAEFGVMGAEHGRKGGRPAKLNGGSEHGNEPGQNPRPSSSSSSSSSPSGGESASAPPDKPAPKPRKARRVPDDFVVTADLQAWAAEKAPLVDWRAETDQFRDWEFKDAHTDWPAAWRTWMRRAQKDAATKGAKSVNGGAARGAETWT